MRPSFGSGGNSPPITVPQLWFLSRIELWLWGGRLLRFFITFMKGTTPLEYGADLSARVGYLISKLICLINVRSAPDNCRIIVEGHVSGTIAMVWWEPQARRMLIEKVVYINRATCWIHTYIPTS